VGLIPGVVNTSSSGRQQHGASPRSSMSDIARLATAPKPLAGEAYWHSNSSLRGELGECLEDVPRTTTVISGAQRSIPIRVMTRAKDMTSIA
jgi:hypothetical protein